MIDKELLVLLVCPLCQGKLIYNHELDELLCEADQLAYPIRDAIPIMLVDEARHLKEQES